MFQLFYKSSETDLFTWPWQRADMLAKSNAKNERLGITGMLLYRRGSFLQALEGEEEVVRALAATISADPRHDEFLIFRSGPAKARAFPDWSMGFRDLSAVQEAQLTDYLYLETQARSGHLVTDPGAVGKLVRAFLRSFAIDQPAPAPAPAPSPGR
jgi:hypothetical protein